MTDPGVNFQIRGREMEKALLAKDWAKTPLGPIEDWPQSLRTTVSLCLASNFPISIIWGPQRIQIYNDGYWPMCGTKHPEAMGSDFKECWDTAWPVMREAFERAQNGETSFLEDQRMFLDREGYLEETFFTHSFSPILDEAGRIGGLFHPVTETTGRMLGERRSRALHDLVNTGAHATTVDEVCRATAQVLDNYLLDLPFGLLYVLDGDDLEARVAGSFGIEPGMLAAFGPAAAWPMQAALHTGQPQIVADLGARFGAFCSGPYPEPPTTAQVIPIPGLGLHRWAGVLVAGVSSRLRLDEAYRDFYGWIAGFLATALAKARALEEERYKAEALAELDRAKSVFFSNVSHEFRTPLTLMLSPLEDLLERPEIREGPFREEFALMHRNGLRLLKLVNTLLEFSRIEGGRAQPVYEATDLSVFTADLASAFRSAVERAGLELAVDCPPLDEHIYVDREKWEKIVLNLISNAFKFTFTGRITVRLKQTETHVELVVEDTGGGIDADELPRIFERFHRVAGAPSRTHEGTGIGLALVKELVLLHGGSIAAESKIGQGSRFTVSIPRAASQIPANRTPGGPGRSGPSQVVRPFIDEALGWLVAAPRRTEETQVCAESAQASQKIALSLAPPARGRVLLVDDNADMREYLRRALSKRYEVRVAADGIEALACVREFTADLVLADVMMPRMDGYELLRELRADSRTATIPVILLSARAGDEARVGGLEAGADDYLIKPFTLRELMARVSVHLNMARMRAQTATALREMNERHAQMIETANDAFVSTDEGGRVLEWNRQAEITFGWRRDEALGHFVAELMATERFLPVGEASVPRRCIEMRAVTRTGEALAVELTVWPVRSHDVLTFSAFVRDIGERKQAEADLRAAKEAAETANAAKSRFLSSMSHEIRTPMNAILGMADMLWESELSQPQRHYVEIFRRAGGNLLTLINDILDLSKIGSGNFSLEQIDFSVTALIEQVMEILAPKAESKSIALRAQLAFPSAPAVVGDPARLQQVLLNLLGNAIKFTERGEVLLRVVCRSEDGQATFEFQVSDTGIGISKDKLEAIFEDFEQAESSTTRRFGGTGLGLGISRQLVRRMGGEIHVNSEIGQGSVFSFHVVLPAGQEPSAPAPGQLDEIGGKRALIVDNSATDRAILSEMCSAWGMVVTACANGAEAIELAAGRSGDPFELALVAQAAPGMDGFETAERLQSIHPLTAIFIVSSESQASDIARCRKLGLAGHLMKPIRRAELLEQIAGALAHKPHRPATPPGGPSAEDSPNPKTRFRVLAAEDSQDNRLLLGAYCQETPYDLTFVEDGEGAVEAFLANTFDLVVMDVNMPVMGGLDATREIRGIELARQAKRTPILAVTADALVEDVERSRAAGCDDHLSKPISKKAFLSGLERWLVKSSSADL